MFNITIIACVCVLWIHNDYFEIKKTGAFIVPDCSSYHKKIFVVYHPFFGFCKLDKRVSRVYGFFMTFENIHKPLKNCAILAINYVYKSRIFLFKIFIYVTVFSSHWHEKKRLYFLANLLMCLILLEVVNQIERK